MSPVTAVQLFSGAYRAQPTASTFAFGVRHSGAFWFRGSFADVTATLRADGTHSCSKGRRASTRSRSSTRPR
jgi:polyisoprenoid-binding protein YceI